MKSVRARTGFKVPRPRPAPQVTTCSCAQATQRLLAGMVAQPWGQVSPSVYETARLVASAPWLPGHTERVSFLLNSRRRDGAGGAGGWGGPAGYSIVPTLSATEALLTLLRQGQTTARTAAAVDHGLATLFSELPRQSLHTLPDTPAIEIIVPYLVALLNEQLAAEPVPGLQKWAGARLPLPSGMDDGLLRTVRAVLAAGSDVPTKLLHSLEVAGPAAVGAAGVRPLPLGMIGASPAATAAWLGGRATSTRHAMRYLDAVQRRHGGPVPSVIPVTAFEQSWVLGGLARAGLTADVPDELVASLQATLGPAGTSGGPGLPPDADTTSGALHALSALGAPGSLECLRPYELDSHFCTWAGERTASPTTNAHVLEAFTDRVDLGDGWYEKVVAKTSEWLCDQQRADGTWRDKWHASPYYATACCAVALACVTGAGPRQAVRRAVGWTLASQRKNGSWGLWTGTTEETAYAIRTLLLTGAAHDQRIQRAAAAGYRWLTAATRRPTICPPLWHDKDLYLPDTIVRAAELEASHLVHRAPEVMARVRRS